MGKKHKKQKMFSDLLTEKQVEHFKNIGMPNPTQNWLELFNSDRISDLITIKDSSSDNQDKAELILEEYKDLGFEAVGLGTNILTMANPYYPGVVFKVALDDYGIADNYNDVILMDVIPHYNKVLARDSSCMVSVQERQVLLTQEQLAYFSPDILRLLRELSKDWLVADLGLNVFLNYGISRDGDFVIIDGSDLYPLKQIKDLKFRCIQQTKFHKKEQRFDRCGGKVKYLDDFSFMVCEKCGRQYLPLEFRPRKDVSVLLKAMSDGYTKEQRKKINAMCLPDTEDTLFVDVEDENEEELMVVEPEEEMEVEDDVELLEESDEESEETEDDIEETPGHDSEVQQEVDTTPITLEDKQQIVKYAQLLTSDVLSSLRLVSHTDAKNVILFLERTLEDLYDLDIDDILDYSDNHKETTKDEEIVIVTSNEGTNNIIPSGSDSVGVRYQVVEESENSSGLSGIYLSVTGDFDEAYAKSGLPIFVRDPDTGTDVMAVTAASLMSDIKLAHNILRDELDPDEEDDEDDNDELIYTEDEDDED